MTIETADMLNQEQGITAPGTILALRRKELGWTQREVADKLRFSDKQIEALENNQFDTFPVEIFVKGYLRSYAKLVSLDETGLLSLYEQHYQNSSLQQPFAAKPLAALPAQQPASRRYLGVVAAVLIVFLLWFFSDSQDIVVAIDETATNTLVEPALELSEVVTETASSLTVSADEPTQAIDDSVVNLFDAPAPVDEDKEVLAESVEAESVTVDSPIIDNGELELVFSGDCWVEVRDATGTVLFANMKRIDERLNLSGVPPFRVLLGDATVASVSYNGEIVNVNPSAENQSARITIGS